MDLFRGEEVYTEPKFQGGTMPEYLIRRALLPLVEDLIKLVQKAEVNRSEALNKLIQIRAYLRRFIDG